ncbi:MAG: glycosyltransferase family 4 protein [Nanoarchaeota archaeon]|nr:glycosyltransferase family 4 protein [Nanoarchaeota archaeon]MBU1855196.1 glycosyltransferase family 4 protein [Nanoarchaeota archaeon]
MKIIHFNDFKEHAGAETAIDMLRKDQEAEGHKTYLFTIREIGNFLTSKFLKKRKCSKIFRRIKPDIVHIHNILTSMGLAPVEVAKKKGIPIVWTFHDYAGICPNTLLLNKNGRTCENINNCDNCVLHKKVIFQDYKKFYELLKGVKCVVASDYVKKRYSEVLKTKRIYWDTNKKLSSFEIDGVYNKNMILFGGRSDEEKGVVYALMALKRLIKKNPCLKMVFLGNTRSDILKKHINYYGLKNHVEILGFLKQEQYFEYVQKAGMVLCVSTWQEPFNLVLLEAMTLGKPVIATRVGGQTEVVGDSGLLVSSCSSIDIANAIERILSDNKLRLELSNKARKRARQFKNCSKKYFDIYYSLLK